MATVTVDPKRTTGRLSIQERPAVPASRNAGLKLWAIAGALIVVFESYVLLKWVTGPNFKSVPSGPTEVPTAMKAAALGITALCWPLAGVAFWHALWRPWRRERRVTAEGLLVIWFATFAWFLDPFANMFHAFFTYTSWLPNMGSWVADIPGWTSITAGHPGAMQAYPLIFVVPIYAWGLYGLSAITAGFMRKVKARRPSITTPGLLVAAFAFIAPIFFFLECVWLRSGIYGYHSAVPSLTLWSGHYYQMPIYEGLFAGIYTVAYGSLLYFRNDRGETIAERGISSSGYGPKTKLAIRFLGMTAIGTVIYMVTYNIPYWAVNNNNSGWPADVQKRSYLTNHICGPQTDQACPAPNLPIMKRGGIHFAPDGHLVVPRGVAPAPGPESVTKFAP